MITRHANMVKINNYNRLIEQPEGKVQLSAERR